MNGQRVLVTGGAGFIGAHVVHRLVRDGADVIVLDDFSAGSPRALEPSLAAGLPEGQVHAADIAGPETAELVEKYAPDVVLHLAAQSQVLTSMANPVRDALANVVGSVAVAEAVRSAGVRRLVVASSGGTVYGEHDSETPTTEDRPHRPVSPYGLSKSTVDRYLRLFHDIHGLPFVSLALANVYGPGLDGSAGCGVIRHFVDDLLGGRAPTICGDGRQTRDFVHVDDVVDAFVRAAGAKGAHVLNIGSGVETSISDVLATVGRHAGCAIPARTRPLPAGEVRRNVLSPARARRVLGWRSRIPLDEGIADLVARVAQGRRDCGEN